MKRRNFLMTLGASVAAPTFLSNYQAMAASDRKKVKITDVKVMYIARGIGWPMVKIETDAGISGIGEAARAFGVKEIILKQLREYLLGEDPLDIDRLYTKMISGSESSGETSGVKLYAISGVEIALWDLAGKLLNAPVYTLLGGKFRDSVPAYRTTSPGNSLDPASCREFADRLKNDPYGITAVKSGWPRRQQINETEYPRNLGWGPFKATTRSVSRRFARKDIARAAKGYENMRVALGDDIEIAVHCHWEFDWIDALELARAVAPIKPMWLEDPMPPDYAETWVRLTEASPVPIAMGENICTRYGFKPFVLNQGCHIIHPDFLRAGGLLESKKIADLAEIFYIPTAAHCVSSPLGFLASAHAAASIRDFMIHELNGGGERWEKFVIYDRPILKDGCFQISDRPGFGVELNEDQVREYLVDGEEWWG